MTSDGLRLRHEYEFSPVIVWDALLDADLVSGWLAEATITPEVGGEYNLVWQHRSPATETFGRIVLLQPLTRLHIDTNDARRLEFALEELEGGFRGSGTLLSLAVVHELDAESELRARADWCTSLEQLDELLRGHPVDWAHWDRDRSARWSTFLQQDPGSTG